MKLLIIALCCFAVASAEDWLSSSEADLVKSSWGKVKNQQADILYQIFKDNPDIMAKFTKFGGQSLDELKGTDPFKNQASAILALVDTYISLLGDDGNDSKIKGALDKMAGTHKPRGVTPTHLKGFQKSVVAFMKAKAGVSGDGEKAWNKAFDAMIGYLSQKL